MTTVKEVAEMLGVSVRTLQYYDRVGLLKPARSKAGYRLYSEQDIQKLQQIISYRDMEFSLQEIEMLISGGLSQKERGEMFKAQYHKLIAKRDRLDEQIELLQGLVVHYEFGGEVGIDSDAT